MHAEQLGGFRFSKGLAIVRQPIGATAFELIDNGAGDASQVGSPDVNRWCPTIHPGALAPALDVSARRLDGRRSLLASFEQLAPARRDKASDDAAYDRYLARAFDLIASAEARQAFDFRNEPDTVRDRHGQHAFGQSAPTCPL